MTETQRLVIMDVGMTLIHPELAILESYVIDEIRKGGPAELAPPTAFECAAGLQLALEADDMPLPSAGSAVSKIGSLWAHYLQVPARLGIAALRSLLVDNKLYTTVDGSARAVLERLQSRGITLVALSNNDGGLEEELVRHGLRQYFDHTIDSSVLGVQKPNPATVELAMAMAGARPEETVMVGDGLVNDYLCGIAAGVRTCVLLDKYQCYSHLPARRVADLQELLAIPSLLA